MTTLARAARWLLAPLLLACAALAPAANVVAPMGDVPAQAMCQGTIGGTVTCGSPLTVTSGYGVTTVTTTITRPSDTTAYAANDALSDSTSAPTSGGFTFTSAARSAGKSVILTDLDIISSNAPGTPLQGEIWVYDTAVTNINDNAAFTVSDSEMLTRVAQIPFSLTTLGANSSAHLQNLGIGLTTAGSANLRFLVRVVNAYTPASAETLTFRAKFLAVD